MGFSHSNILRSIINHACLRFPGLASNKHDVSDHVSPNSLKRAENPNKTGRKRKVFVIFGGNTSERQVSLMSGTNVWLNLKADGNVRLHITIFLRLMTFSYDLTTSLNFLFFLGPSVFEFQNCSKYKKGRKKYSFTGLLYSFYY